MNRKKTVRKLAVIFVTDVVGFSKLMENNETGTLESLRSCKAILENLFKEHGGEIFNTGGDSVLAQFQSAVSAVICAGEFQNLIHNRNSNVAKDFQMEFRVGINMGDVVVEGKNLYGDGVNVAARLEALAQPGGVCLSKGVYDLVDQKTQLIFHDIGRRQVKNTNVHAFDLSFNYLDPRNDIESLKNETEESDLRAIAVLPFSNLSSDSEQEYLLMV